MPFFKYKQGRSVYPQLTLKNRRKKKIKKGYLRSAGPTGGGGGEEKGSEAFLMAGTKKTIQN